MTRKKEFVMLLLSWIICFIVVTAKAQTVDKDAMTDFLCKELVQGMEMDSITADKFIPLYRRNRAELNIAKKAIQTRIEENGGRETMDYHQASKVQQLIEDIQNKYNKEFSQLFSYRDVLKLRHLEYQKEVEYIQHNSN